MVESTITTLADLPFYVSGRFPKPDLIRWCTEEGFKNYSSRTFFDTIRDLSLGLSNLGIGSGDRVALLSGSRPEWVISDFAILTIGAITVPIYPTLPLEQVGYIFRDAGISVAIVEDEIQATKVRQLWPVLPNFRELIVFDAKQNTSGSARELTFTELQSEGHRRLMSEKGLARKYKEFASSISSSQLATIIYTSGTTGEPKGVMLTHEAIVANLVDVDTMITVAEEDVALSFLPLSHAFERTVVYLYLFKGVSITFAECLDTIARDMKRVSPTLMTGPPRIYEKLYAKVFERISQATKSRQMIFNWAMRVGQKSVGIKLSGRKLPLYLRLLNKLGDRLVFSTIRERTGGRLKFVVSGGAPLSTSVASFLFSVGIPILEGYGLTETAPVLTVNPENAPRLGTVGKALPSVELKIASDGEVLARGPNIMQGYLGRAEETTTVLKDGWFYTGDVGRLDSDGYLILTDRKKELLITANGKNVAPQPIEQKLKQNELVSEAMLIGDRRPFLAVLILPDFQALIAMLSESQHIDWQSLIERADVRRRFDVIVSNVNAELPPYEQIKRFALLPTELRVETGELTPTLKIKRRVVLEKWHHLIDELYSS